MSEPQSFKLIIEDDEGRRSVVPVQIGTVTLGRHEHNIIRLKERNVSRHHARLEAANGGGVVAYDLESYNGLWANGARVAGHCALYAGDVLRIGDFLLELKGDALLPRPQEATERTRRDAVGGAPPSDPSEGGRLHRQLAQDVDAETTGPGGANRPSGYGRTTEVSGLAPPAPSPMSKEPTVTRVAAAPGLPPPTRGPPPAPTSPLQPLADESTSLIRRGDAPAAAPQDTVAPTSEGALSPPFAKLTCLSENLEGQIFAIERVETVLGRTLDNEVELDHRSVSRHHAKIVCSQGRFRLVDLDSANGTLVNGELYSQAELQSGDIIELGHVRLRFMLPTQGAESAADARAQPDETKLQSPRHRISGSMARAACCVAAAATVAVLMAVALPRARHTWLRHLGLRRASVDGANASHPSAALSRAAGVIADTPSPPPAAASQLMLQARRAFTARQWRTAEELAGQALQAGADHHEVDALVARCALENTSQAALNAAVAAHGQKNWADAYGALQGVNPQSAVAAPAAALLAQVKPALIETRLADCKEAIRQEDWDEAELLLEEVDGLDPTRQEIGAWRSTIQEGRNMHPAGMRGTRSGRSRREPSRSGAAAARPTAPSGGQGPGHTAGGAPAGALPQGGRDSRALYAEGTRLLNAKQYARAIDELLHCIAADKNFAMCYRALGIAYADANNGPEAVRYYRLYLKVDPSARDSAQVRQLLQQYDAAQPQAND